MQLGKIKDRNPSNGEIITIPIRLAIVISTLDDIQYRTVSPHPVHLEYDTCDRDNNYMFLIYYMHLRIKQYTAR